MQTGWRRISQWPPRALVEDEAESLAHEHSSLSETDSHDDDALSRGSVDQQPIIEDVLPEEIALQDKRQSTPRSHDYGSVKSCSSVESLGPPTPTDNNPDRRYVYIPHDGAEIPLAYNGGNLKETARKAGSSRSPQPAEEPRGRPPVSKIATDFGSDLQRLTGSMRRARSPYAFVRPEKNVGKTNNRLSGEFMLSTESAASDTRFPSLNVKRSVSARPIHRKEHDSSDSSDSGYRSSDRRRPARYSTIRSERPSWAPLNERPKSLYEQRSTSYSLPQHEHPPPPKQSLFSSETPLRPDSGSSGKTNSPYHSSDESSKSRVNLVEPRGSANSARLSYSKPERPRLDTIDPRQSFDPSIPVVRDSYRRARRDRPHSLYDTRTSYLDHSSVRTPMEDYFDRAMHDHRPKRDSSPPRSPDNVEFSTPPKTPPRSPGAPNGYSPLSSSYRAARSDLKPLTPMTPVANTGRTSGDMLPSTRVDPLPSPGARRSRVSTPGASPVEERRLDPRLSGPVRPPTTRTSTSSAPSGDERDPRRSAALLFTPRPFELRQPPPPRPYRSSPGSSNVIPQHQPAPPKPPSSAPILVPCPRPRPVAGYHDWYTIQSYPYLDFCPSCMGQIGDSKFRHLFIPSLPKPRGQEVQCTLARPWMRMAWIETIKQRRDNLNLLYRMHDHSTQGLPCAGKKGIVRTWNRIIDPSTGTPVPHFHVCSTCVRSVEILMPELRGVFKRISSAPQERTCDLRCDSKRFGTYMDILDRTAEKAFEENRESDLRAFCNYAHRVGSIRECPRDDLVIGELWHFIPTLPEFTICEECYMEVVLPLRPEKLASKIDPIPHVMGHKEKGVSCQLYSDRMRKIFRETVKYNDFDFLRAEALRRYKVERLLQERHAMLMREYPSEKRTEEMRRNVDEWKKWE